MSEKQWIIVGLDPGTTIGYAVLDLGGKLLKVDASKEFNLSNIIEKIIYFGKIIAVGTDKQRVPGFVEEFAAKTGAKIISPDEDMPTSLKSDLTKDFELKGDHQKDAIASAVLAYKKLKPTLEKINGLLYKSKKQHLKNKVVELVIKNDGFSIRSAIGFIEKPSETNKIIKEVIENKKLKESDFFKLNEHIKEIEEENKLLRSQASKLKDEISRLSKNKNIKLVEVVKDEKLKSAIKQKDSQLSFLYNDLKKKNEEITSLKEETKKLIRFLALTNQNILLKKIENLGSIEFEKKRSILNIKESDVLLVNNPNIISRNVYETIKEKVNIVLYKEQPSKKIKEEFNFIYIDAKKMDIEENEEFALVDKDKFEKMIDKDDILKKVLKEYKPNQT